MKINSVSSVDLLAIDPSSLFLKVATVDVAKSFEPMPQQARRVNFRRLITLTYGAGWCGGVAERADRNDIRTFPSLILINT